MSEGNVRGGLSGLTILAGLVVENKGARNWYAGTKISRNRLGCSDAFDASDMEARETS